jgi:leucyl/phenylalanyl-tRNA--protein transferase
MTAIRWLPAGEALDRFPPAEDALDEPNGLLAAGGDREPQRLLLAYRSGIFPWYEAGQPILWWSPNPRAVLHPADLHVSRSLRRAVAAKRFEITADTAFERVLAGCAAPRRYTDATWITDEMASAYTALHRLHFAHSFEAWQDGRLVGGLYGVAIGRVFFGESMFARATDASKVAFVHAVRYLVARAFELIDCQVASAHLRSLGACDVPRSRFLRTIARLCDPAREPSAWNADFAAWVSGTE